MRDHLHNKCLYKGITIMIPYTHTMDDDIDGQSSWYFGCVGVAKYVRLCMPYGGADVFFE